MVTLSASAVPPPNYVNIPDANFKAYLVGNIAINTNNDAEIETSEAAAFTGSIVCDNLSITDLTGIEAFTSATLLSCFGNLLTNLNVSQNIALTNLRCYQNSLTSLDVSQNTALTNLSCYNNSITALDVTQNTLLTYLVCTSNSITNIDVTHNTALTTLFCNNNSLPNLNITQNTALVNLNCSNTTLTNLDITNNTALTTLRCYSNLLTNLDVTQNNSLITLLCYSNLITSLDVSQNIALANLNCYHNSLTNLVVTQNTALSTLSCSSNLLTNLNVANGNNTALTSFNATNNPNLTCIQVDDVTYSTTNWTVANNSIDATASFSMNCSSVVLVSSIVTTGQGGATDITTAGGTLQMEATVLPSNASNATYTWSITNGTGTATISATGLVTAQTNGIVTVTATANDGSGITGGTSIMLSNQTTGIHEINSFKTTVYPNPTTGKVTFSTTDNSTSTNDPIEIIEIYNLTGQKIETFTNTNTIDISNLTNGIYTAKVVSGKSITTKKIVKK